MFEMNIYDKWSKFTNEASATATQTQYVWENNHKHQTSSTHFPWNIAAAVIPFVFISLE